MDRTASAALAGDATAGDVQLLRWPRDQARRAELGSAARPLLLLVEDGALPPVVDGLEDWIRVPAPQVDVRARIEGLRRRAQGRSTTGPDLDEDGMLRLGDRWVSLPPVEARLMAALVDRFGAVVSRDALNRAGWPHRAPGRNALDVRVLRLRRRIAPVGLVIRTVRSRGYVVERAAEGGSASCQPGVRQA